MSNYNRMDLEDEPEKVQTFWNEHIEEYEALCEKAHEMDARLRKMKPGTSEKGALFLELMRISKRIGQLEHEAEWHFSCPADAFDALKKLAWERRLKADPNKAMANIRWNDYAEFTITLRSGSPVRIVYDGWRLRTNSEIFRSKNVLVHIQMWGPISETGYRSHFFYPSEANKVFGLQLSMPQPKEHVSPLEYIKTLAEHFHRTANLQRELF